MTDHERGTGAADKASDAFVFEVWWCPTRGVLMTDRHKTPETSPLRMTAPYTNSFGPPLPQ
jgi:hypothetical protein